MVLQKLQHFVMRLAGISIDFYYKELIEIGTMQACFFYLAPGLICEGYWQVKFSKVYFSHCGPQLYTHVIRRLTNGITAMCITHGFMVGLGNNGFTNPIISSCLEISSAYNPFSSRFSFPVAIHRCNVCRVNGLHNIPPRDHARVQNSWHLLEYKLFKAVPTLQTIACE